MPELDQFIVIAAAIVALQFIAAIIGPGALKFVSVLAILGAVGMAAYAFYLGYINPYPGEQTDYFEHALQFGIVGGVLLVTHWIIRGLFRAMARASAA
jgi:hypothetical protein